MLFNSFNFLIFFPVVLVLYTLTPRAWRWLLLLLASVYFYMSFVPAYILILFYLITIDFFLGIFIEKASGRRRMALLLVSICANLGTLFFFKYLNFFSDTVAHVAKFFDWNYSIGILHILLPLGLSYHVFQSLSYVLEVYYGRFPAERHYGIYALYVMFFPQLVAGPIERPQHLLPQLKELGSVSASNFRAGVEIMGWGFFKKILIADIMGVFVDAVYHNLHVVRGPALFAAMLGFAMQLYGDFSGYSDIAVGSARVFGITLVQNFNFPFFAGSVAEFWRRWHISLSNWARDYIYYPLAVAWAKKGRIALHGAVLVTFVVLGVWHGAGWNFFLMGVFFGTSIIVGNITKPWRIKLVSFVGLTHLPSLYKTLQVLMTIVLASVGWVFFRAPNTRDAFSLLGRLGTGWSWNALQNIAPAPLPYPGFLIMLFSLAVLFVVELLEFRGEMLSRLKEKHAWFRWGAYYGFALLFLFFILTSNSYEQRAFIYFQF